MSLPPYAATTVRRAVRNACIVAVVTAGVAWLIGVSWSRGALIATMVVAAAAGFSLLPIEQDTAWSELPTVVRHGTRDEVSRRAWRLTTGRKNRVTPVTIDALRQLAVGRLERHGVALGDRDRAEPLLGSLTYRVVATDLGRRVHPRVLIRCLAALERLDATGTTRVGASTPTQRPGR